MVLRKEVYRVTFEISQFLSCSMWLLLTDKSPAATQMASGVGLVSTPAFLPFCIWKAQQVPPLHPIFNNYICGIFYVHHLNDDKVQFIISPISQNSLDCFLITCDSFFLQNCDGASWIWICNILFWACSVITSEMASSAVDYCYERRFNWTSSSSRKSAIRGEWGGSTLGYLAPIYFAKFLRNCTDFETM